MRFSPLGSPLKAGLCVDFKTMSPVLNQVFSTFIKPTVPIPEAITELTHITDDMVADAPAINYVLPDFYKYCYGCSLVAQNIAFDYGFLNAIGKKMLYKFDNPQYDTMVMARNKIRGLKNYKLGTICEY